MKQTWRISRAVLGLLLLVLAFRANPNDAIAAAIGASLLTITAGDLLRASAHADNPPSSRSDTR